MNYFHFCSFTEFKCYILRNNFKKILFSPEFSVQNIQNYLQGFGVEASEADAVIVKNVSYV